MQPENSLPQRESSVPRWQQLLSETGLLDQLNNSIPGSQNTSANSPSSKTTAIQQALTSLTENGQVIELRVLGINKKRHTDSGYFDDVQKLAKAAMSYDGRAEGIYFTVNPVNPALLARANNRVKEYAEHTTSDHDVLKRINLPIDFDPVRPAGISSTQEEQQKALVRAWACRLWLGAQGWPEPVFASSGNGAHLVYAIDLPNNGASADLIKSCLSALSVLFSDNSVKVDTSTGNASRIFKLYGTLACKGDHTPERPHRRAAILNAPEVRLLITHEQLTALAAHAPQSKLHEAQIRTIAAGSRSTAYGKAALEKEIAALAATTDGNRNNQLFQSAAALFSLVASNALEHSEVWNALFAAACSIGLSEAEAHRTMASAEKRGMDKPRTIPGRQAEPITDIVESEHRNGKPALSTDTNNAAAEGPNKVKSSPAAAAQLLMHVDDLDKLPPIRWLIQDILPANSLAEVYGAPGAGKTHVVFDMAQTLAGNGQTVIYVVAEGLQGYRGRKRAWQQFHKLGGGNLFIWSEAVHLFDTASVRAFLQVVKPKQPALVVFDTLSRCSLGADENSQKDMNFILEALDLVRRETGATVVAVHHTNAAGLRERGSNIIRGGIDTMMEVSKEDDLIVLSCIKMKDFDEFAPLCLKPTLVDIDEEKPVPVLIPAERRIQTPADKLTSLQLDILNAIGMEMFAESGIKSNQLDELLPPTTKRASKYYGLNTLIKLGYVKPHVKGDPYRITEEGRLKLSNAQRSMATAKSNESKTRPSPFIWTLPESSPMSSPIPHTFRCGMDQTIDQARLSQTSQIAETNPAVMDRCYELHGDSSTLESQDTAVSLSPTTTVSTQVLPAGPTSAQGSPTTKPSASPVDGPPKEHRSSVTTLSPLDIARYAAQVGVTYPTTNGGDLYKIASIIPRRLRIAFEEGLNDVVGNYRTEVCKRGDPDENPIPDILALYLLPGLVSAAALYESYHRALSFGHGPAFMRALQQRSSNAFDILRKWLEGNRMHQTISIGHPIRHT